MDTRYPELEPRQVDDALKWVAQNAAALGAPGWFVAGALGLAGTAAGAAAFLSSIGVILSMSSDVSAPAAVRLAAANAAKMREMGAVTTPWATEVLPALTDDQIRGLSDLEANAILASHYRAMGMWTAAEAVLLPAEVSRLRTDLLAALAGATQQQYQATERAAQYQVEAMLASGEAVAHEITNLVSAGNTNALLLYDAIGGLGGTLALSSHIDQDLLRSLLSSEFGALWQGITGGMERSDAVNARGIDSLRTAIEGLELRAGDVTVQAPPAPNVSITAPIETGALGTTIAAALPAVGVAMAAAIAATAGSSAHAGQQARYGCMGGFSGSLVGIISALLPTGIAATVLLTDNPIRQKIQEQLDTIIGNMCDPAAFTSPAREADAVSNATRRLTQAVGYGMEAQMIAYIAESSTPLKQMGFGQLAGFVGDLAGFKRIAAGLMGTLEDAAIYQPLRWKANREFRPTLPNSQQLALMYQKRSLTRAELEDFNERSGLPDLYNERLPGFIFNDPNPGMLIRAFQLAPPSGDLRASADDLKIMEIAGIDPADPDWYYKLKFAKSGLDDTDVEAFVPIVKMGLLRREQTLRYDAITRLYRDGYKSRAWAEEELALANAPADRTEYRLAAIDLQRDYKLASDARAIAITAMGRGVITRATARELLESLGMDAQRIEVEVLKGTLGLLPTQRLTVATEDDILGEAGVTL